MYRNIGVISASKILSLILRCILFDVRHFLFFLKASHANIFLLFMSSSFPSKLPRYLQVFQSWLEFLFIVYSSVFSWFTSRFLFVRVFGTVFFIYSLALMLVVIHEISSAYCWSIMYSFWVLFIFWFLLFLE